MRINKYMSNIFQIASYGSNFSHENDDDLRGAAHHAANNADEDSSFFSGILNQLGPMKQQVAQEDLDEDGMLYSFILPFDRYLYP